MSDSDQPNYVWGMIFGSTVGAIDTAYPPPEEPINPNKIIADTPEERDRLWKLIVDAAQS